MIKKTIKYTDYNGNVREEPFYFNLTKVELVRMESNVEGGLAEKLKRIAYAKDGVAIMEVMEELIQKSYGKKTADGGFVKSPKYLEEFVSTEAYSELFMELVTDADKAVEFAKGILPADMRDKLSIPAEAN